MRIYLMPVTGTGTKLDPRKPKYVSDVGSLPWSMMDYGNEPTCLFAVPFDPATHAALIGHADVTALPSDLSQQIGAQLTLVQNAFENFNIPGSNWVQTNHTYLQVLRVVALVFQFMQRFQGKGFGTLFGGSVTLDTKFNQLTAGVRANLLGTAQELGFDTSSLSGASSLRLILKSMADQFNIIEIFLGDQIF